jgi:undecaprenyl-diphosphatase
LLDLDRRLERWVVHHRGGGLLDHAFVWLTQSARVGLLWLAIGIVVAYVRRRPALLLPLVAADLLADLTSDVIKALTDRPRPPLRYPEPHPLIGVPRDSSFPSGHAATSFACATVLTAYEPRLAPLWIVLASAVAFSRVYVGVHYPLDVIGGAALGVVVGLAVLYATRALRRRGAGPRRSPRSPTPG